MNASIEKSNKMRIIADYENCIPMELPIPDHVEHLLSLPIISEKKVKSIIFENGVWIGIIAPNIDILDDWTCIQVRLENNQQLNNKKDAFFKKWNRHKSIVKISYHSMVIES